MLFPGVRHEVSFWFGSDRPTGDLRLPASAGAHPVVLLVREPDSRERDYSAWLDALADAGIASFSWDRPDGAGGDDDPCRCVGHQAREVLAAVDRLRTVPEVDASAVALLGWGAGGWAAAKAATFSNRIAALVLACVPVGGTPSFGGHDVRPTLSAVTTPVLALYGEHDPLVPLQESARGVREALRDAGHLRHQVAVVRGADHALRVRAAHGLGPMTEGRYRFGDWPVALTELLVTWLTEELRPEPVPAYAPPLYAPTGRVSVRPRAVAPLPAPVRQMRRRARTLP